MANRASDIGTKAVGMTCSPHVEQAFRREFVRRNFPRARFSTGLYVAFVLLLVAIDFVGIGVLPDTIVVDPTLLLRLGVALPALIAILCSTYVPIMQRHYQLIVGSAVTILGTSVISAGALAAHAGSPAFQMGDVMVIAYGMLFLGLLTRTVITVAAILTLLFVLISGIVRVPFDQVLIGTVVLVATAAMFGTSAHRVEQLIRESFLETLALNKMAERDSLTGLYNRRKFESLSIRTWNQAKRDNQRIQIAVLDIDYFKNYNDAYGHQAGDNCLREVAQIIARGARRPLDFVARYGGEEFVLVLYGPDKSLATAPLEEIRKAILRKSISHCTSDIAEVVTISVGSAAANANSGRSLGGLIQRADEALYRAKASGRNRVEHIELDESDSPTGVFSIALSRSGRPIRGETPISNFRSSGCGTKTSGRTGPTRSGGN